jgi:hypothetical protein
MSLTSKGINTNRPCEPDYIVLTQITAIHWIAKIFYFWRVPPLQTLFWRPNRGLAAYHNEHWRVIEIVVGPAPTGHFAAAESGSPQTRKRLTANAPAINCPILHRRASRCPLPVTSVTSD